jgi:hypothetical protein
MKYIITESQRDKAVFSYLDNQDFEISKIGASTYFKHPDDDGFAQIKYGGRHHNEELYFIYRNLVDEVSSFFSLSTYKSARAIGEWVKNKLNLEGVMLYHIMNSEWSLRIPSKWEV